MVMSASAGPGEGATEKRDGWVLGAGVHEERGAGTGPAWWRLQRQRGLVRAASVGVLPTSSLHDRPCPLPPTGCACSTTKTCSMPNLWPTQTASKHSQSRFSTQADHHGAPGVSVLVSIVLQQRLHQPQRAQSVCRRQAAEEGGGVEQRAQGGRQARQVGKHGGLHLIGCDQGRGCCWSAVPGQDSRGNCSTYPQQP
jgi:hypothetical protein